MADDYADVELVADATVERVATAVLLATLAGVLAQVSIPLPGGVPFSLQPFAVFAAGLVLGPLWGGFALLVYLVAGLAGAPVFSNLGAGLGYLAGPTGGFLVGFVVAALVIGAVAHRQLEPRPIADLRVSIVAVALLVGLVPIYAIGLPWFASVQGWSLARAGTVLAPFAAGDLLKAAITVGLVRGRDTVLGRLA